MSKNKLSNPKNSRKETKFSFENINSESEESIEPEIASIEKSEKSNKPEVLNYSINNILRTKTPSFPNQEFQDIDYEYKEPLNNIENNKGIDLIREVSSDLDLISTSISLISSIAIPNSFPIHKPRSLSSEKHASEKRSNELHNISRLPKPTQRNLQEFQQKLNIHLPIIKERPTPMYFKF